MDIHSPVHLEALIAVIEYLFRKQSYGRLYHLSAYDSGVIDGYELSSCDDRECWSLYVFVYLCSCVYQKHGANHYKS